LNYLLDTNTIIALIEGRPPVVRVALRARVSPQDAVLIPTIATPRMHGLLAKSGLILRNKEHRSNLTTCSSPDRLCGDTRFS
jgi:hypothetical protein